MGIPHRDILGRDKGATKATDGIKLGMGEIISGAFAAVSARRVPFAAFVVGMSIVATLLDQSPNGGFGVEAILAFVADYVLLRHLLAAEGMAGNRFFGSGLVSFFGAGLLGALGMIVGFIFLVIPGLILMARWSISSGLVIAEDSTASESLSRSWDLTRASQWSIVGVYFVGGLVLITILGAVGGGLAFYEAPTDEAALPIGLSFGVNLAAQEISALGTAVALFLTKRLTGATGQLDSIFS